MNEKLVVLLLSGPVAVGKSTLATQLVEHHGFRTIRSGNHLRSVATQLGSDTTRRALQELGDTLDLRTGYLWLIDSVASPQIEAAPGHARWLLDSVRKERQVEHFRRRFPHVVHVHLTAKEEVLRARYAARLAAGGEYEGGTPYDVAIAHPNEIASRGLVTIADQVVVSTSDSVVETVLARLAPH
jgi:adenylate kinase family enzyme